MTDPALFDVHDNIAVITLNKPPVNGLGHALRTAIHDLYLQSLADDTIQAIVIGSSGKLFCGGADISEFGTDLPFQEPALPALCTTLEASTIPIVAAINGMALGGGCELALACDYRIALPSTKLGLPEVNLGLLPGAGGTQRLPRLAGAETALKMITGGKPASADEMHQAGVIDRIHQDADSFLGAAIGYAKELVTSNAPVRTCADLTVDTSELPEDYFNEFRQSIAKRTRGYFAPERCIQAVEVACQLPLEEGLKVERELFTACMATPQARAQRHLFFADRTSAKVPDINPKTTAIREINKVAIIGSGTMGGGIAMNFINAGIPTTMLDLNDDALKRGVGVIEKNYQISVDRNRLTAEQVKQRMELLTPSTDYQSIANADLVIEAVFENMDVKKTVFETLDTVCKQGAILASNTSTLDVDEIAAVTDRPEDVIGLHFFSPANVMRLLEVVRGEKTADDVLMTTIKMAQRINKVPAVSRVCWGFIGNRIFEPPVRESNRLILEGASPQQIDDVLTDFGFAMGMCSVLDLAGLDVSWSTRQDETRKSITYAKDPSYCAIGDKIYELGQFGQKTGDGFYIYDGRDKQTNPIVIKHAEALAKEFNISRREIDSQEILERVVYMLINEGAYVLEEGIACRSSDIDVVYCNGYGFPKYRGGPMQYADEVGLDTVLAGIEKYRKQLGDYGEIWFQPAPLLEQLAKENKSFKDFAG